MYPMFLMYRQFLKNPNYHYFLKYQLYHLFH
jgi:hypothetical protein